MKIEVEDAGCVTPEASRRNLELNLARGLPVLKPAGKPTGKRVAVIGGAPSLPKYADELRAWDGPRWALNGAWAWCRDHGIDADLFLVDPQHLDCYGAGFELKGCKRAYLGPSVDASIFDLLVDAEITIVPAVGHGTVATGVILPAAMLGHSGVAYFGCDGSRGEQSHAYVDEPDSNINLCLVECGGETFVSDPILITQCKVIVDVARERPHFISATPEGLLAAMLQNDGDYEITFITPELAARMRPAA